jgi:hypothetical protein
MCALTRSAALKDTDGSSKPRTALCDEMCADWSGGHRDAAPEVWKDSATEGYFSARGNGSGGMSGHN